MAPGFVAAFNVSVRALVPTLLLVTGLFSQSAHGDAPIIGTIDFSTGTHASEWLIFGAGASGVPAVKAAGTNNISFSSTGNESGTFIPGASAAGFNGAWKAVFSFDVPASRTIVVELAFSGLNADDRTVLTMNPSRYPLGKLASHANVGYAYMGYVLDDSYNVVSTYFDGSKEASGRLSGDLSGACVLCGPFRTGTNTLTLWVNNNPRYPVGGTSADGGPVPLQGVWDGTTVGVNGTITYRDYQIRAFPHPGAITPNPAGNTISVPKESRSYFNALDFQNDGVIHALGRLQNLSDSTLRNGDRAQLVVETGARFTNDGSLNNRELALITNNGDFTSNARIYNYGDIWNDGKLWNRAGAQFEHRGNGSFVNFEGSYFENYGSFFAANRSTFENRGTVSNVGTMELHSNTGRIDIYEFRNKFSNSLLYNGGSLSVDFGKLNNEGTIRNQASLTVESEGWLFNGSGATIENSGGTASMTVRGHLSNMGTLIHNRDLAVTTEGYWTNAGHVHSGPGSKISNAGGVVLRASASWLSEGRIVNEPGGIFTVGGRMEISGTSVVRNYELFVIEAGGEIFGSGTFGLMDGRILNNGTFSVENLEVYPGSEIRGHGVFATRLVACPAPGCRVRPGQSPGTMTFTGDLILGAGSILELEVASGAKDEIIVLGNADIDADVQIMFLNDYRPTAGMGFNFLTVSGSKNLNFGSITVSGLPVGYAWDAAALASTGELIITSAPVPEPRTYLLMLLGLGLVGLALRRTRAATR